MNAPTYIQRDLGLEKYKKKCQDIHMNKLKQIKKKDAKVLSSIDGLYHRIEDIKIKSHQFKALQRETEIQRKNKHLLSRLTDISYGKWSSLPRSVTGAEKGSLNAYNRTEFSKRVEKENLSLAQRLLSKKPNLSKSDFDMAYKNHLHYKGNLSKITRKPKHQGRTGHLAPLDPEASVKTDDEGKRKKNKVTNMSLGRISPQGIRSKKGDDDVSDVNESHTKDITKQEPNEQSPGPNDQKEKSSEKKEDEKQIKEEGKEKNEEEKKEGAPVTSNQQEKKDETQKSPNKKENKAEESKISQNKEAQAKTNKKKKVPESKIPGKSPLKKDDPKRIYDPKVVKKEEKKTKSKENTENEIAKNKAKKGFNDDVTTIAKPKKDRIFDDATTVAKSKDNNHGQPAQSPNKEIGNTSKSPNASPQKSSPPKDGKGNQVQENK